MEIEEAQAAWGIIALDDGVQWHSEHEQAAASSSDEPPPRLDDKAAGSELANVDLHADRRVIGAAATFGTAAGTLLVGPVSGLVLGAAALYAATREDGSGSLARRAGAMYLQATDCAIDGCLQAVDQGVQRLSEMDLTSMPSPVRAGVTAVLSSHGQVRPARRHLSVGSEEMAQKFREKYPDRIPVVCERSPYATGLPDLAKSKFVVQGTMACSEFKYMIHKQLAQALRGDRRAEQTIYIFVNGFAPKTSTPMSELYDKFREEDGFLYITYGAENTLGWLVGGQTAPCT